MTAFVFGLIGLVAGSLLQTTTGLFTDWRAAKREHKVWLRDKREAAFVEYMTQAHNATLAAFRNKGSEEALEGFAPALIAAQIYAPTEAAKDYIEEVRARIAAMYRQPAGARTRDAVTSAMRKYDHEVRNELDIERKGQLLPGSYDS
ncbi:hypothetical protein GCM10023350_13030 [Nocardioides endophyticus]|uniref:Uncharacterized protein n=1 Tax=Nocardioides endophyticus TaxID=1353775 RepID=A0ABP8YNM2_9ACTN